MPYDFIHCLISENNLECARRFGVEKERRSHLIKCGFPIIETEKLKKAFGDIHGKIALTLNLDIVSDTISISCVDDENCLFETDALIPPECILNYLYL